ncbi:ribonuclease III [Brachybacterium huguangmaarense]|uniref:Ribonuclease 3 n=1 Tax=Brachybacterium huguangmaarense TaxID=1652028 RepID=A0ABY6FYS8_9MICO|nr:ribonuclease III [Brachybacterium huguangmaarense]UYG16098.1 ribonuclease III [Brachybacterium huguangmaarense]
MTRSRRGRQAADPAALLEVLPLDAEEGRILRDSGLLELALTHRSYAYEHEGTLHNERLEFLGDAVLGLATTEELYRTHPELPEGELAKRRAAIVNTRALALVGRRIELGAYIRLGRGEDLSGGREKASILADTMEAVIGAVHLALGETTSRRYVLALLAPMLDSDEMLEAGYDFKTRLQEIAAQAALVPVYRITESGPEHAKTFRATATIEGIVTATGEGASKKDAELAAAAGAVRAVLAERGESLLTRG